MPIEIERPIEFAGLPNCIRLSNGTVELIVTTDVGPHVLRYGHVGGPNLFFVAPPAEVDPGAWHPYGGHRLWIAPEVEALTYAPANQPVEVDWDERTLTLTAPVEAATGLVKSLAITLAPEGDHVRVLHRIEQRGERALPLAPWALSVMATGGTAIFPQEPFAPHPDQLTPARPLVLWSFTDMADPRWTWGGRYILLRQEPGNTKRQKVGLRSTRGWMAYALGNELFIKRHAHQEGATYADFGCNVETYTDESMLELETLGPLVTPARGEATEHVEDWFLAHAAIEDFNETALDTHVLPLVAASDRVLAGLG